MRRYFIAGLLLVMLIIVAFVLYGAYVNKVNESQIEQKVATGVSKLRGEKAEVRNIFPALGLDTINIYSKDVTDVIAHVDGRIVDNPAPKNSRVRKGDVIFVLENEDLPLEIEEAKSNIAKAESELSRAENNLQRYEFLLENNAASAKDVDEAKAAHSAAQANLNMTKTKLERLLIKSSHQKVTAPIDGNVLTLYHQVGTYVAANTPLARIGNYRYLYFDFRFSDSDARRISEGQNFSIHIDEDFLEHLRTFNTGDFGFNATKNESREKIMATVIEIFPPLSESAWVRDIFFRIDNDKNFLTPHTFGDTVLRSQNPHRCLSIPTRALILGESISVFVYNDDGTISRRKVEVGFSDGKYTEILKGLKAGDIVITSGTKGLENEMKATVELEGAEKS